MRRAVIENEMDDLQACAQGTLKQLQQEGFEIGKLSPAAGPGKRQPRSDHQGTEQLHGAHPFIPIRHVEGVPWRRCLGRTDTLAGLDGGLFITAHHRFSLRRQRLGVFVEIEHRASLVHKAGIGRALPRVIPPGFDLVRAQPGAYRSWGDVRHDLLLDGDLGEFLPRPAWPGFAVCAWRTTGQRDNLSPLERRESAGGTSPRRIALAVGHVPALPPALDRMDTAAHLPGDLRVSPGGLLMSEEEHAGPLDFRKRGRVTAAELLQMPLLLWRELDEIFGQRSWHKDSPPDQAQVSRIVIDQDLAHVKPAKYLLRTVLRIVQ